MRIDTIEITIPNALSSTRFTDADQAMTEGKIRAIYLAKLCEMRLIAFFEHKFDKKFKMGHETQSGYDLISVDEEIKIEVKSCTKPQGSSLRGQKFKNKINECDYVALVDLSKSEPRASLIEHDDFFSDLNGKKRFTKCGTDLYDTFWWYKDYLPHNHEVRDSNTQMFLDNEIILR